MITASELHLKQIEINNEIMERAKKLNKFHEPLFDGVVNEELFLKGKPKILWILKEPWEYPENGESGGGWDLVKDLLHEGWHSNKGSYAIMAYISYSILNDFKKYSNISYVSEDPNVGNSMKYISYINVKKFPGSTSSNMNEISQYYLEFKDILIQQIDLINPDIVIGGNTLHLFFDDLKLKADNFNKETWSAWWYKNNNRFYIHSYHPNQRTITNEKYVDDMVSVVKNNY